jgi:hypothetical protein
MGASGGNYTLFQPGGGGSSGSASNLVVQSKTTTFTASVSDDVYLCDTSGGAYTATLPAASGNSGKVLYFIKTTSDFNVLTIATSTPTTLARCILNGEVRGLISNGSTWVVIEKIDNTDWISYTPTFTGLGTVTNIAFYYKKDGSDILIRGRGTVGTPTATEARISFPGSLTSNSLMSPWLVCFLTSFLTFPF